MDSSSTEGEGYLPILSVRFDPSGLPPGAVDLEDLAQFLDGMQLALNGIVRYDISTGYLAETDIHPRLIIVRSRESSFVCDVVINLFSGNTIAIDWRAATATGVGIGILLVVKGAVKDAAAGLLKEGMQTVAREVWAKTVQVSRQFAHSLESAASPKPDSDHLPPDLVLKMAAGLKKMSKVGAKQTYGRVGITVGADNDPSRLATFNAEARRRIESLVQEVRASEVLTPPTLVAESPGKYLVYEVSAVKAAQEPVEMTGTIEDPSERTHQFVLDRSDQRSGDRYVTCFYDPEHEDLIRRLYARREHVKVKGQSEIRTHSNRGRPWKVVHVSAIERTVRESL